MKKLNINVLIIVLIALFASCQSPDQVLLEPDSRQIIMTAIASDHDMSNEMMDAIMQGDHGKMMMQGRMKSMMGDNMMMMTMMKDDPEMTMRMMSNMLETAKTDTSMMSGMSRSMMNSPEMMQKMNEMDANTKMKETNHH